MTIATVDDVAARLGRGLSAAETLQVPVLLTDVETILTARLGDLQDAIDSGTLVQGAVLLVECNAVIRVLKNPGGYRSETTGPFQITLDTANTAAGYLTITADEWGLLGVGALGAGGGAWSYAPVYGANDPVNGVNVGNSPINEWEIA